MENFARAGSHNLINEHNMKLKNLEKETQQVAIKHASKVWSEMASSDDILEMNLAHAFVWVATPEGHDFWAKLNGTDLIKIFKN